MEMKTSNLLQQLAALCMVLLGFYCPISLADKRPIITLSVGSPFSTGIKGEGSAYIIKIFANGYVEYEGLNAMDVMGKREYQMDKATLKALLKKVEKEKENVSLSEGELFAPSVMTNLMNSRMSAILGVRFRLSQKEITLIGEDALNLYYEILKAVKEKQWGDLRKAHKVNYIK
jgi:hypothetical protein